MQAKLYIPAYDEFEAKVYDNLPDDMVLVFGRIAACSLAYGMSVRVVFSDNTETTIEA